MSTLAQLRCQILTSGKFPVIEVYNLLKSEDDNIGLVCGADALFQKFGILWWANEVAWFGIVNIPAAYQNVDVAVTGVLRFPVLQTSFCAHPKSASGRKSLVRKTYLSSPR